MIGVGGVGGFAVQIASALGGQVIAIDVSEQRLFAIREYGALHTIHSLGCEIPICASVSFPIPRRSGKSRWSGRFLSVRGIHKASLAFALLTYGASIGGWLHASTRSIRLANLMAFDATLQGNWGCVPELYPAALRMILSGQIPFVRLSNRDRSARQ